MTYAEKLKDPRWQRKRLSILERDEWACQLCKDKKETLHVHHKKYNRNPWEAKEEDLLTLCQSCHAAVSNKLFPSLDKIFHLYKIKVHGGIKQILVLHNYCENEPFVDVYLISGSGIAEFSCSIPHSIMRRVSRFFDLIEEEEM